MAAGENNDSERYAGPEISEVFFLTLILGGFHVPRFVFVKLLLDS